MHQWRNQILKNERLYGLNFAHEGKMAWYIFLANKSKEKSFSAAMNSAEPLDLSEYGSVISKGWGELDMEIYDYIKNNLSIFISDSTTN